MSQQLIVETALEIGGSFWNVRQFRIDGRDWWEVDRDGWIVASAQLTPRGWYRIDRVRETIPQAVLELLPEGARTVLMDGRIA